MKKRHIFLALFIAILSLSMVGVSIAADPTVNKSQQGSNEIDLQGSSSLTYAQVENGTGNELEPLSKDPGTASVLDATARPGVGQLGPTRPDTWTYTAPYPQVIVRYAHVQCQKDYNTFYIFGGVSSGAPVNTARRYNADLNHWTDLAPIPFSNEAPAGACLNGKIYVTEGGSGNHFNIYDISANSWTEGAALPRVVAMGAMAAWEGKIYVMGGDSNFIPSDGVSDQVNIYDTATNSWSVGTPMPGGVAGGGFVQLGQYVYIVGGWPITTPVNSTLTQRYNMENNTWQTGPAFIPGKSDFALAATSQYLYAIGGDQTGIGFFDSTNSVWRYDYNNWPGGTWDDTGDNLPFTIQGHTGGFTTDTFTGGEVWSVGGLDGTTFTWHAENLYKEAEAPWMGIIKVLMPLIRK